MVEKVKMKTESYLDGEKLFEQYFAMGDAASVKRLTRFAISEGMVSSAGRSPTPMGVWKSMWRWASKKDNKERAFQIFSNYIDNYEWRLPDENLPWTGNKEELWHKFMLQKIKSAWQFTKDSKYQRFLKENGWA